MSARAYSCQSNVYKSHCGEEATRVMMEYSMKVSSRVLSYFNCIPSQFSHSGASLNRYHRRIVIRYYTELKGHCFVCFSFWLRVLD